MPGQQLLGELDNLVAAIAQRRDGEVDHAQPIVQIFAKSSIGNSRRQVTCVAAMIRTFTLILRQLPRGWTSPSCSTCKTWPVGGYPCRRFHQAEWFRPGQAQTCQAYPSLPR